MNSKTLNDINRLYELEEFARDNNFNIELSYSTDEVIVAVEKHSNRITRSFMMPISQEQLCTVTKMMICSIDPHVRAFMYPGITPLAKYEKACDSYDKAIKDYINNDVEQTRRICKQALNSMFGMRYGTLGSHNIPKIENVIFNDPATIVFWSDHTKTVVKVENEEFDPEKGLAMAISKKALGNKHSYFNVFKKWLKKYRPATVITDVTESLAEIF